MLNRLDWQLHEHGFRFARYADDFVASVKRGSTAAPAVLPCLPSTPEVPALPACMNFTYSPAVLENWVIRKEVVVMILKSVFDVFVQKRPVCVLARGILERLMDPERIDELFENRAKAGYTRTLQFSTRVQLMADVVLGVHPAVHAAFQSLHEAGGNTRFADGGLQQAGSGSSHASRRLRCGRFTEKRRCRRPSPAITCRWKSGAPTTA